MPENVRGIRMKTNTAKGKLAPAMERAMPKATSAKKNTAKKGNPY
jgi:hypothetical protein